MPVTSIYNTSNVIRSLQDELREIDDLVERDREIHQQQSNPYSLLSWYKRLITPSPDRYHVRYSEAWGLWSDTKYHTKSAALSRKDTITKLLSFLDNYEDDELYLTFDEAETYGVLE